MISMMILMITLKMRIMKRTKKDGQESFGGNPEAFLYVSNEKIAEVIGIRKDII